MVYIFEYRTTKNENKRRIGYLYVLLTTLFDNIVGVATAYDATKTNPDPNAA